MAFRTARLVLNNQTEKWKIKNEKGAGSTPNVKRTVGNTAGQRGVKGNVNQEEPISTWDCFSPVNIKYEDAKGE